jgi:hypothetical protein
MESKDENVALSMTGRSAGRSPLSTTAGDAAELLVGI